MERHRRSRVSLNLHGGLSGHGFFESMFHLERIGRADAR
jgi:hypothetical protein